MKKHVEVEELWVPIEGYPNYEVSNYGRICNVKTGRELTTYFTKYKETKVTLSLNGKRSGFYVKELVAQAFFLNYGPMYSVEHVNKAALHDNSVLNLTLEPILPPITVKRGGITYPGTK